MPVFLVLSRLTEKGAETLLTRPERVKEVNMELEGMGVKVKEQYIMLGDYDFVNIVEAPDEATLYKALVSLNKRGTIKTSTFKLIPVDEFLEELRKP